MHPRTGVLILGWVGGWLDEGIEFNQNSYLSFRIIFHIIYIGSIFDIYFRSPLVQGVDPVYPPSPAPASRLLLAVGEKLI